MRRISKILLIMGVTIFFVMAQAQAQMIFYPPPRPTPGMCPECPTPWPWPTDTPSPLPTPTPFPSPLDVRPDQLYYLTKNRLLRLPILIHVREFTPNE